MHVNRLLRSQHRLQEYVVFDFLHRVRYAEAVRGLDDVPAATSLA